MDVFLLDLGFPEQEGILFSSFCASANLLLLLPIDLSLGLHDLLHRQYTSRDALIHKKFDEDAFLYSILGCSTFLGTFAALGVERLREVRV